MHDDGDCPQRTLLADMLLDAVRPSGNYSGFVNTDGKKTIQITADSIECWIRGQVKYLGKCRHLYGTSATLPGSPGSCRGTAEMIRANQFILPSSSTRNVAISAVSSISDAASISSPQSCQTNRFATH